MSDIPTPDMTEESEREALARAQWDDPVNVITWDELTERAVRGEGDYQETRDYALASAGRGISAGFVRRPPADDKWEALRGEAERVERAAWAEIHGQDASRKYSVAEVKRIVYSFDNVLSSLLRRTAIQEPGDECQAWYHFQPGCTCPEPQGEPTDAQGASQ